jgi:GNAT superfamily N-acetyltransferase
VDVTIVDLEPEQTAPLRRSVLRDGTWSDEVVWDGDDAASTFHLGAMVDDQLVAISTWMRRDFPGKPGRAAFQIRGMATAPTHRGRGLGDRFLTAGVARCRELGAELVWARARDTALAFYEHRCFEVVGEGYIDAATGLPHHDVFRIIAEDHTSTNA